MLVTQTEMSATLSTPEMKRSVPLVRSSAFFSSSSQRRHRRRQRLYFEVIRDDDNDLVSERDVLLSWIYTRFYVHFVGISVEVFTCSKRAVCWAIYSTAKRLIIYERKLAKNLFYHCKCTITLLGSCNIDNSLCLRFHGTPGMYVCCLYSLCVVRLYVCILYLYVVRLHVCK